MVAGLSIVGFSSHSLGVLAAGGDYLLDCSAIIFGLLAISFRNRNSEKSKATAVAALLNVLLLLSITITVTIEATNRLINNAPKIHALPVLLISLLATGVMTMAALILQDHGDDLHMRSVWLDTVADAVSSAAIGVAAIIILVTNRFFWADSAVAILISIAICYQALKLLREVLKSLTK